VLNCALDCLFIFQFGWGVTGAAASSSISTILACALLLLRLVKDKRLVPGDLVKPPKAQESMPVLSAGFALSSKSMVTMYTIGLASQAIAALGAASLAAHEIIKQLFFLTYIGIEPISVAGQSLVAECLGKGKAEDARRVAYRLVGLAVSVGVLVGVLVMLMGPQLAHIFTKDKEVIYCTGTVIAVVSLFQPLDAINIAQEGILLGAREHVYISRSVIATSLCCFAVLYAITRSVPGYSLLHVWLCIKILTIGRIGFSSSRLYFSSKSPILGSKNSSGSNNVKQPTK